MTQGSKKRVLYRWASLGRELAITARKKEGALNWSQVQRMINAAEAVMAEEGKRLIELLARSTQSLAPLGDPLLFDFGANRWLKHQREEAYSDWLAWILEQVATPPRIYNIFGLNPNMVYESHSCVVVKREPFLEEGHDGHLGKIDITVSFGKFPDLAIEVKKTDADSADTEKCSGYSKSLPQQTQRILLAVSGEREIYEGGFCLITWKKVCIALRKLARKLCQEESIILAAMILAFAGSVEGNLLGFPVRDIRNLAKGIQVPISAAVANYIEQWLEE